MASPAIAAGHRFVWDVLMTSAAQAPKYFRESKYRSPSEPTDGLIQYAKQTKHDVFGYLLEHSSLLADFNNFMGHTMGAKQYWVDWYPVEERLLKGLDVSKPLLVDIGGGRGHDLQAFVTKYPNKGRLVLEDLAQGLNSIVEGSLDHSIERVEYDFFTLQPIKGSHVLFHKRRWL